MDSKLTATRKQACRVRDERIEELKPVKRARKACLFLREDEPRAATTIKNIAHSPSAGSSFSAETWRNEASLRGIIRCLEFYREFLSHGPQFPNSEALLVVNELIKQTIS